MVEITCKTAKALWERLESIGLRYEDVEIIGFSYEEDKLVGVRIKPK